MLDGVTAERLVNMSKEEKRLLDNLKKGFHKSDLASQDGTAADRCMEELFKAIDVAKNLRRSIQGTGASQRGQKKQYIEFIELDVPDANSGGLQVALTDARTGEQKTYSFAELVYDARCMVVHENENLNAAEKPNYHILFDWELRSDRCWGTVKEGRAVLNGRAVWHRLRQSLAKFITSIEGIISAHETGSFSITCEPEIGSIKASSRGKF